jgi:hypothetical protein
MRYRVPAVAALMAAALAMPLASEAGDVRGQLGIDSSWFPDSPAFVDGVGTDQSDSHGLFSGYGKLDWSADIGASSAFSLSLFARAAPDTDDDFFGDVREAVFKFNGGDTEMKLGVLSETWGVLEAWNTVDIVNQRDMVEDFQGDVKLGQPGLSVTTRRDDLQLSFFALTYSRERRIAEGADRLRTLPAPVRDEHFEDGQWAPSFAVRAQYRLGDLDLAVSQFST